MFKKYNLNPPKKTFTILSKVGGLPPDNLHSSAYARGVEGASICERDDARKVRSIESYIEGEIE
jgi:hypothetical protein